jgi:hypothetical protein
LQFVAIPVFVVAGSFLKKRLLAFEPGDSNCRIVTGEQ